MPGPFSFAAVAGLWDAKAATKLSVVDRYIDELEATTKKHRHDARALETELRQMRARLKKDLIVGNVPEPHYRNVDKRIRDPLGKARARALQDDFAALPHGLLARLEVLLEDGVFTPDECALCCGLVESAEIPATQRAELVQKLHAWVSEDAGTR